MIEVHSVALTKVVSFDDVVFQIDQSPLTFIYGQNFDAQVDEGLPGNGAGKSLLCASIPNVRFSAPPSAKQKKAKKDMLYKKGSSIELHFHGHDGCEYIIEQLPSKFNIFKDGDDQQVKTIPHAEKYIEEIFPLSDVEFYTTAFVATQRRHSIQSATDSERLDILTSIFKLDYFSKMREHFARKQREIKDNEIRLQVLEQNRLTLRKKVQKANADIEGLDTKSITTKHADLTARVAEIASKQFAEAKKLVDLESLVSIEIQLEKLRETYTAKSHPSDRIGVLKQLRQDARAWVRYDSDAASADRAISKIEAKLAELGEMPESTASDIRSSIEELEAVVEKHTSTLTEFAAQKRKASELKAEIKALNAKLDPDVDLSQDVESEIAGLSATLRLESLLTDHECDDGKCPTCLSVVDLHSIKRAVANAKKKLPGLRRIQKQQAYALEIQTLVEKLGKVDYDSEKEDKLVRIVASKTLTIDKLKADLDTLREFKRLKAERDSVERPDKLDCKKPTQTVEEIDAELDICGEVLKYLEAKQSLLKRSQLADFKSLKRLKQTIADTRESVLEFEEKQRKLETALAAVSGKMDVLKSHRSELDLYQRELDSSLEEIDKLRPSVEHKQVVDALLKAYSTKGIKAKVADHICTLLETNLNTYRDLIFAEAFKFTVDSTDTGIAIRVDRGNNHESDVRMLSAAEGDCFTCLLTLAILPLIPDSRRLNFLILDEPMCHAHEVTRQIFRERFLPVLCEVVPHVIVITQNDDDFIEGSRKLYVVKEKGVSYLEEDETVA